MLSAGDQLERIADEFVASRATLLPESFMSVAEDDLSAYAKIHFAYPTGHRLHIELTLDVTYGYPHWALYSFQFQWAKGQTIFRYDNWPHHKQFETYPHHKHVGPTETPTAHPQPSLALISREIQEHVSDPMMIWMR